MTGGLVRFPRVTRRVRSLVCLLLGLVISVTVAWIFAFVGQPRPPTGPQQRVDLDLPPRENWKWLVNHRATIGHHIYIFRLARNKTTRERSRVAALSSLHQSALPGWVNRPTRGMYHETHAYGFPFLCLARKEWNSHDPDFVRIRTRGRTVLRVAVRPIAVGLVADALCYAIVMWPVVGLPGTIVRRSRRKRGLCTACSYDLRKSVVCPECGAEEQGGSARTS